MYPEEHLKKSLQHGEDALMPTYPIPEILRSDLTYTLLYLLSLNITNFVTQVDFPTPVSSVLILEALTNLYALQAIDDKGMLTVMGERMAELFLEPKYSRFLLLSSIEVSIF